MAHSRFAADLLWALFNSQNRLRASRSASVSTPRANFTLAGSESSNADFFNRRLALLLLDQPCVFW